VNRAILLCIGSELRADDAAAVLAGRKIAAQLVSGARLEVILGETAPENFTGVIINSKPDLVILFDALEAGHEPGTVVLMDPEKIEEAGQTSTHKMPAGLLVRYLKLSLPECRIVLLGIQPKSMTFGGPVSDAVHASIDECVRHLTGLFWAG
jgi:hydrogenase maturation protease HycI